VNVELRKCGIFRFARVGLFALHVSGRFLPFYCSERKVVSMEPRLISLVPEVETKESKLRLEPAPWLMAWDCYALAAVALSQVCGFALHGCSGQCLWVAGALRDCSVVRQIGPAAQASCARYHDGRAFSADVSQRSFP
jgi:hypothetical protein